MRFLYRFVENTITNSWEPLNTQDYGSIHVRALNGNVNRKNYYQRLIE